MRKMAVYMYTVFVVLAVFQNDRKHVGRNLIQTLAAIFIL